MGKEIIAKRNKIVKLMLTATYWLQIRYYNENFDLLYEVSCTSHQEKNDQMLSELLTKSKFFLNIGNVSCY